MKWSKSDVDQVTYDVTVPFIRMAAGPMDYTQGAMRNATRRNYHPVNSEAMSQGTRCHQLAEYVVFDFSSEHVVRLSVQLHGRAGVHQVHRRLPYDMG